MSAPTTVLDSLIVSLLNGIEGTFQLHLKQSKKGPIVSSFYTTLKSKKDFDVRLARGTHPKPDVALTISEEHFLELATGKATPVGAFMAGNLSVKGNMQLALTAANTWLNSPGPSLVKSVMGGGAGAVSKL